jgi:hypothetical protein
MLYLAGFGSAEHQLFIQAGIEGLRDLLAVELDPFRARIAKASSELAVEPPPALMIETWWEQARTLEES